MAWSPLPPLPPSPGATVFTNAQEHGSPFKALTTTHSVLYINYLTASSLQPKEEASIAQFYRCID